MGKIFGILLIVVGIWVGITIFTEGTDNAFGGLFAEGGAATTANASSAAGAPLPKRVRDTVGQAYRDQEERASSQAE